MRRKTQGVLILLLLLIPVGVHALETQVILTNSHYSLRVDDMIVSVTYATGGYHVAYDDHPAARIEFDQLPSPVLPGSQFKNPPYIQFMGGTAKNLPIAFGSLTDKGEPVATIYVRTGTNEDQVLYLYSTGKITVLLEKGVSSTW